MSHFGPLRYWPPTGWTEDEREAICAWVTKHGLDPNATAGVAVAFDNADLDSGTLHAVVYLEDQDGHRWVNWVTGEAATTCVKTPLVETCPVPGRTEQE